MRHDAGYTNHDLAPGEQGAATGPLPQLASDPSYPPHGSTHPLPPNTGLPRYKDGHRRHRMPLSGPFLLIVLGTIFLLNNFGIVDWSVWGHLWRLWPLIPIAIGADMLVGRRNPVLSPLIMLALFGLGAALLFATGGFNSPGRVFTKDLAVPLNGASSGHLSLQLSEGEVSIGDLDSTTPDLLAGKLEYTEQQGEPLTNMSHEGAEASVTIHENNHSTRSSDNGNTWQVLLNPRVPFSLQVVAQGAHANLNLEKLTIPSLELTLAGNETTIMFPKNAQAAHAVITGSADSLMLFIPEGVEARIMVPPHIDHLNADRSKFTRNGEAYESPGYNKAVSKLDIDLRLSAHNLSIQTR